MTTLTTDAIFEGQRFAILAMFSKSASTKNLCLFIEEVIPEASMLIYIYIQVTNHRITFFNEDKILRNLNRISGKAQSVL